MSPSPPASVWIVEDDVAYRDALRVLVAQAAGMSVGHTFGSAEAALRAAADIDDADRPDLILMDVNLPGVRGTEAVEPLRARLPGARVVMLTVRDDPDTMFGALKAGASGYLLKGSPVDYVLAALREALGGGVLMPPAVARRVLGFFQASADRTSGADAYGLTEREREVLRLITEGLVQKEVAAVLKISPSTVSKHVERVYDKLHVHTAPAAVAKAIREGLV